MYLLIELIFLNVSKQNSMKITPKYYRKYSINNKDKFLIDDITNWLIILVNNLPNFIFDSLKIRFFHK